MRYSVLPALVPERAVRVSCQPPCNQKYRKKPFNHTLRGFFSSFFHAMISTDTCNNRGDTSATGFTGKRQGGNKDETKD